ncbi:MAG: segregation/condensation protein A, partial [Planctomycetota bacterium]
MTVEPQMRQEDWQVRLPDFEGPFDLLLHLVRRGELDVSTMPLHEVADEYLEILAQLPEIDVEEAGEFLLVASLLVDLKIKRLEAEFGRRSPDVDAESSEVPEVVPDDPAMQLTQALLRYQRVRDAAAELRDLGRAAHGGISRPKNWKPCTMPVRNVQVN